MTSVSAPRVETARDARSGRRAEGRGDRGRPSGRLERPRRGGHAVARHRRHRGRARRRARRASSPAAVGSAARTPSTSARSPRPACGCTGAPRPAPPARSGREAARSPRSMSPRRSRRRRRGARSRVTRLAASLAGCRRIGAARRGAHRRMRRCRGGRCCGWRSSSCTSWSPWFGFTMPNQPMGDVYLVYEPWARDALAGHGIVGIDGEWVYPQLALLPMLLAQGLEWIAGYEVAWALMVTALDALAFALLVGRGRSAGRTTAAVLLARLPGAPRPDRDVPHRRGHGSARRRGLPVAGRPPVRRRAAPDDRDLDQGLARRSPRGGVHRRAPPSARSSPRRCSSSAVIVWP